VLRGYTAVFISVTSTLANVLFASVSIGSSRRHKPAFELAR
jgi:hypothetical protein